MKTILNPFRIRLDTLQLAGAAITLGFVCSLPFVRMILASRLKPGSVNKPERRQMPYGTAIPRPGTTVPIENTGNGQNEAFDVAIKFVRTGVRSRKSSKPGSPAGDSAL
jgi:hypothetical protein